MEGATVTVGMAARPPPLARITAAAAVTLELGKLAKDGTRGVWNRAENKYMYIVAVLRSASFLVASGSGRWDVFGAQKIYIGLYPDLD
jgi:hypothetical protein